jgi:hypothetical protein
MKTINITRLAWNSNDWKSPSGRNNKCKGVSNYECQSGFGWEEWLFNTNHQCEGYQYGFIQCFIAKSHKGKTFEDLHLFTRKCEGNCDPSNKGILLYVGLIKEIEVLSGVEPCYQAIIDKNKKRMRTEVVRVGSDAVSFDSEPKEIGHWFNVRFKISDVEFNRKYEETILPFDLKNFRLMYNLQSIDLDESVLKKLKKMRT